MTKDEFLMAIKLISGKDIPNNIFIFIHLKDGRSFDVIDFEEMGVLVFTYGKRKHLFPYDYLLDKIIIYDHITIKNYGTGYTSTPTITFKT